MALLALWNPNIQFLKTDGTINAGGKLVVTDHNDAESIPANYSDADGTTLNASPIVLDALGRATCYIDDARTYDLYVKDSNGATLWTVSKMTPGAETIIVRAGFSVSSNDSSVEVVISVDQNGVTNYDLSIQKEIDRATEAEKGLSDAIDAEKKRAEEAERTLSESISEETERAIAAEKASRTEIVAGDNITVDKTTGADGHDIYTINGEKGIDAATANPLMDCTAAVGVSVKYAREDHVHPSDTSREDVANKTTVVLGTSDSKYPTDKAVAEFVNSSIATNTANYISNNGEPFTSVEQLEAYSGPVTNNDYAFVTGIDSEGNTYYDRYKATVSGSTVTWALEYRLNNSSFTAAQWSAINSGITSELVAKIHTHSNKDVLDSITSSDVANWNSKQGAIPDAGSAANPVHFKDGKAVAGDSINNCKLTLKVGDATVGDGFTANAVADFEYRVTGEQIASALTAGSGIAISGKTVSTNLPLSNNNEVDVKKDVWYIFAMANVTGGVWERCWDFLISSNHNSSAQMRLFISPRISASGLIESATIVQVDGHVTPAQLEKYKIATVKDSSGNIYCCLCVKHSNSNEYRKVQWNLRNSRGPSWLVKSTPLSNYTVVSERLLSTSMSSNRLVCYKPTNNAAVGNATQPVYVDEYGMIHKCSGTLDTVDAKGIVIKEIDGENVICFE